MPLIGDRPDVNLRTVIYGTDFSLCSQNAGLYAACIAKYFSATLLVAHAFALSQAAMEIELDHKLVSQQRKDLEFLLSRKAFLLASDSLEAIPTLLDGDPREVLLEAADSREPSLIVLGTHGGGWMERELIGSVAEHILRSTRWPTLTVGPQVPHASSATFPFQRILYATDFSRAAAHAAAYAVSFAEALGATTDILNVIGAHAMSTPIGWLISERIFMQALTISYRSKRGNSATREPLSRSAEPTTKSSNISESDPSIFSCLVSGKLPTYT